MTDKKVVNVMAFGGGVQTIALLIAAIEGDYHTKPDFCVFGNPGMEHPKTMEIVKFYTQWAKDRGVEIITGTNGSIMEGPVTPGMRTPSLPLYTADGTLLKNGMLDGGVLWRQCTYDYKILVCHRETRKKLGYAKGEVVRKHKVNTWLGISIDEAHRMKPSNVHWQEIIWPLIEMKWSRGKCLEYIESKGLPMPIKSACVACPFHGNDYWRKLKANEPDLWEMACKWDEGVRAKFKKDGKLRSEVFVHSSRKPLREAPIGEDVIDLFGEECAGYCGT